LWQSAPDPLTGWRRLRRFIPRHDRATRSVEGSVYDHKDDREVAHFIHDLLQVWNRPDATILRAKTTGGLGEEVWKDPHATIEPGAKFIGPVWVGAGRSVKAGTTVVGPAVVWDDPSVRPATEAIQWLQIEPTGPPDDLNPRGTTTLGRYSKRLFDLAFSALGILLTLPL